MSRPAPEAPPVAPDEPAPEGEARDHSGRLLVRMPKSLHAELARTAERDGTSLNAFIVAALSGAVGWRTPEAGAPPAGHPGAPPPATPGTPRGLSLALKANLVLLAIAVAVAIALLITAWQG
jgi:hypothetical protein